MQQFVRAIGAGEYSPAISAALKEAEAELGQVRRVIHVHHPRSRARLLWNP